MSPLKIFKQFLLWLHHFFYVYIMDLLFEVHVYEDDKFTMEIYLENQRNKFLKTFETDYETADETKKILWNLNINPELYDKEKSQELIKEQDNIEESQWNSRILFDSVFREDGKLVTVIMYYDLYKNGFAYYCNDSLNYNILNALAMKYVVTFFCRDFFIDNHVFQEDMDYTSPFSKLQDEKTSTNKKNVEKKNVFAKFKNYQQKNASGEAEKFYIKNKFISYGKLYNFSFIKKPKQKASNTSSYELFSDKKLSYNDYKKSLNN